MVTDRWKVPTDHSYNTGVQKSIDDVTFILSRPLEVEFDGLPFKSTENAHKLTTARDTVKTCTTHY